MITSPIFSAGKDVNLLDVASIIGSIEGLNYDKQND